MTYTTNNNNDQDNEGADDVTADEVEASKNVDLRELGIEPLSTPIGVIGKLYRSFVTKVRTYNEQKAKQKEDPKDPVVIVMSRIADSAKSDNAELRALCDSTRSLTGSVRDLLFSELEKVGNGMLTAHIVVQELKSLLSDAEDNFDYYFARAVQAEKDKQGIVSLPSEDVVTDKATAVALRTLLETRIKIAELTGDDVSGFFKVSDAGRKAFDTDQIPRLPKLDEGDSVPRSYSSLHLSFRWSPRNEDGSLDSARYSQEDGITLNDVAHNVVSQGGYRITGQRIAEMLKKAGHGIGATDEEWTLEFPTGALHGKKSNS